MKLMIAYPRIKRPDKAGIIRRLLASSTEAKANFAAVNVRNDSVVFANIFCAICKWWLPSDCVGSIPSIYALYETCLSEIYFKLAITYILHVHQ